MSDKPVLGLDEGAKLAATGFLQLADGLKELQRTCGGDLSLLISLLVYPVIEHMVTAGLLRADAAERVRQAAQVLGDSLHVVRNDLPIMPVFAPEPGPQTPEQARELEAEALQPPLVMLHVYALQLADLTQDDDLSEVKLIEQIRRIDRQIERWIDSNEPEFEEA